MFNTLVIPSAGEPQNTLFPGVYDLMIPINGKPTINYILENRIRWNINKVIILLNKNDFKTKKYLNFLKLKDLEIIVENVESSSLGETIDYSKKYIKEGENIIVQLGDTLLNNDLDFTQDFIVVSDKKVSNAKKWTFVDEDFLFYDNLEEQIKSTLLVSGIYFIKNTQLFFQKLENEKCSFYSGLGKYYKELNDKKLLNIKNGYYDLGHLDEYYKSKIDFLRVRSFNSLQYDSFRGIITKTSSHKEKISQEINWFKNLPNDLKNFTPRLVDYTLGSEVKYSSEFYGYNSLADIFLYSNYSDDYLKNLIEKMLDYTSYVKQNYNDKNFSISNFYDIYLNKTFSRLEKVLDNKKLQEIYNQDILTINGKQYKNIKTILDKESLLILINDKIYNKKDCTIIHGDLCFSNILFDVHNGLFKLIDPRGKFGENGIWGDMKYDLAKLRHSIHGKYENIISDLFNLEIISGNIFNFEYFNGVNNELVNFFDKKLIELGYDVEIIKYIEGLLYLSMIPFHSDSLDRQIVMYLTATILFNETIVLGK